MIQVSGMASIRVRYTVDLNMTEAEFDALTSKQQDELIDNAVDWQEACRSGELDDVEITDLEEF